MSTTNATGKEKRLRAWQWWGILGLMIPWFMLSAWIMDFSAREMAAAFVAIIAFDAAFIRIVRRVKPWDRRDESNPDDVD
jgi:hypothetical protein